MIRLLDKVVESELRWCLTECHRINVVKSMRIGFFFYTFYFFVTNINFRFRINVGLLTCVEYSTFCFDSLRFFRRSIC